MKHRRWFVLPLLLAGLLALGCGVGLIVVDAQARALFDMEPETILQALERTRFLLGENSLAMSGEPLSEQELQEMLFPGATLRMLLLLRLLPFVTYRWPLTLVGAALIVAAVLSRSRRAKRRNGALFGR